MREAAASAFAQKMGAMPRSREGGRPPKVQNGGEANGEPVRSAASGPQLGVRWQFGGKQTSPPGPPSDDLHLPWPLKDILHHQMWKAPVLRQTMVRLRLSRYGACLALVAALATLNGVCTVLFFEAIMGVSPPRAASDGTGGQLNLIALRLPGWSATKEASWSAPPTMKVSASVEEGGRLDAAVDDDKDRVRSLQDSDLDSAAEWTPSDNKFLRQQESKWVVNAFSTEPGVYILQQKEDFGCVLLLQDVCYVYMLGKSSLHNHNTGVWFAQDLPKVTRAEEGGQKSTKEESHKSVFTRDLSNLDLSKDVCNLYSPQPKSGDHLLSADTHDLTYMQLRAAKTYGRFIGQRELALYIEGSTENSRQKYFDNPPIDPLEVGVVTRHDSREGHFGENLVALAEVAKHFSSKGSSSSPLSAHQVGGGRSGGRGEGRVGTTGDELEPTVFFPGDKRVHSNWTVGVAQLLFGQKTAALAGQSEGSPMCFRNAAFVLNARQLNTTANLLRNRAYRAVTEWEQQVARLQAAQSKAGRRGPQRSKEEGSGSGLVPLPQLDMEDTEAARAADAALETLGGLALNPRGRLRARGWGTGKAAGYQITVAEEPRSLGNPKEVVKLLERSFYGIPVKLLKFHALSLAEQISTMRRTALFVSMYGPPLSNVVFMPRGSVLLALFPYKFYSEEYRRMAVRSGVDYFFWENTHIGRSRYTDNCMLEQGFAKLTKQSCWTQLECLSCARDRSITTIAIPELEEVLVVAKVQVKQFIERRKQASLRQRR